MAQIHIPRWDGEDGFQHYKNRDPIWIKVYTRLHSNDDFLELTGHQRAVLLGLWLEYARSGRNITDITATLSRRLNLKVTRRDLDTLKQKGFIEIPLAERKHDASPEKKREEKKEPSTSNAPTSDFGSDVVVWPDVPGWSRPSDVLAELLERRNG